MNSNIDQIKVGDGMTEYIGSDCYPFVVVRKSAKCLYVKPVATGKNRVQWPNQDFPIYLDQPEGEEIELRFTERRGGAGWVHGYAKFGLGAQYYLDPSF